MNNQKLQNNISVIFYQIRQRPTNGDFIYPLILPTFPMVILKKMPLTRYHLIEVKYY